MAGPRFGLALMAAALYAPAWAGGPEIVVERPWLRATPPGAMAAAGYGEIRNGGTGRDRLLAAASPAAGRIELHRIVTEGTVMRMELLADGIPVPAGGVARLEPGGPHLMLMDLKGPLREGARVPMALTFEHAGDLVLRLPVAAVGAKAAPQ